MSKKKKKKKKKVKNFFFKKKKKKKTRERERHVTYTCPDVRLGEEKPNGIRDSCKRLYIKGKSCYLKKKLCL